MSDRVIVPKYEPRCYRCGHHPDLHNVTACEHGKPLRNFGLTGLLVCDCPGWKRDEGWPPPVTITVPS